MGNQIWQCTGERHSTFREYRVLPLARWAGTVRYAGKYKVDNITVLKEKWKDARDEHNSLDSVAEDTVLLSRCVWVTWTWHLFTTWLAVLMACSLQHPSGIWQTHESRGYVLFSYRPWGTIKPSIIAFGELKIHLKANNLALGI